MMIGRVLAIGATALLTGCGGPEVPAEQVTAVDRWVRKDQAPARTEPVAMWYANGNAASAVCGEIVAPPSLRAQRRTLRFVYDPGARQQYGQVELHEDWVVTDGSSASLLDTNRALFNDLWDRHCAGSAPISRRVAAWTGLPVDEWWSEQWAKRERSADEIIADMRQQQRAADEVARELKRALH